MNPTLPIDHVLPELLAAFRTHPSAVLHAPPGAGKTTRVPLALLELLPPEAGRIVMLEPRRLAASGAAHWMAASIGETVGTTVGYSIRFERRVSKATRIEVVTEGILTRMLQRDPLLEGVGMVIFDEFHERSIHADLGLALCREVQAQVRPDLRILVMSATLETAPVAKLLGDAPVIISAGKMFPVEEVYLEDRSHQRLPERACGAVQRALAEQEGDILVFLPGAGEIGAVKRLLDGAHLEERGAKIHQLYGDLPFSVQQAAIRPGSWRKVVLATSIAETSLTIDGVRVVIDSGFSRRMRHDPASGMNRLVTVRSSRASAEQRRGRAGRLESGVCYRLYGRHTFTAMTPQTPPEILETDLAPLVLELAAWGNGDPASLGWLDPPPAAGIEAARQLLQQLGALDGSGMITSAGREMNRFPLHPRLGRLLLLAKERRVSSLGCDLAALLSERDIVRRGHDPVGGFTLDMAERLSLLRGWRRSGRAHPADPQALQAVERVAGHLRRMTVAAGDGGQDSGDSHLAPLLLAAYPDRVGQRREGGDESYLLTNGKGARLAGPAPVSPPPLLIGINVDGGKNGEGIIRMAVSLEEEVLRTVAGGAIIGSERVEWDRREGRVVAVREERYGALRLSSVPAAPRGGAILPVVLAAVAESRLELLPRTDSFEQLRGRIRLLGGAFPDQEWPDVSDDGLCQSLEEWLAPCLEGVRTAQQLASVDCAGALTGVLDYRQCTALDQLAPTHLTVPSGSRIRLDYCAGELPVLAVKLQELFGLAESPTVANGRVGVLLHLLSPAGRPLQVTRDLRGFWNGSYHEVKKEMKGRYPKHPWPDDPWSALPTRRTKNR